MPARIKDTALGRPYYDVLGLSMAHALGGAEEEADPYVLSLLEREYIAWAIALYYQCAHCQTHHRARIVALQKKSSEPLWAWERSIVLAVVFSRLKLEEVSDLERRVWIEQWDRFVRQLGDEHGRTVALILYAIAYARDDKELVKLVFEKLVALCCDRSKLRGVVRDVSRVTLAMKGSTSAFRVGDLIMTLLDEAEKGG